MSRSAARIARQRRLSPGTHLRRGRALGPARRARARVENRRRIAARPGPRPAVPERALAVSIGTAPCRMFFYGTLLPGERDHALLASARLLGPALTEPLYQLVELNVYAALIPDGKVAVHGELY